MISRSPGAAAMYALNFYSPIVADQLRSRRKTATIRLGDKSKKYKKGMVVQVLVGARYGPREKVFDAVIDKVEVKKLARALAAGHRARQPGGAAAGGAGDVPRAALQPRGRLGRDRHADPLFRDPALSGGGSASPKASAGRSCRAAGFALDGEDRAEARVAVRAARAHLARALRALRRQLALGLVEVALREAARQAESHPVAERLAPLLAKPVRGLAHTGPFRWPREGVPRRSRALPGGSHSRAGRTRGVKEGAHGGTLGSPVLDPSRRASCDAPPEASQMPCSYRSISVGHRGSAAAEPGFARREP